MLDKIKKCYRYKDYETAIFLLTRLQNDNSKLLLGIMLFENDEMSRAIFHLEQLQDTTSMYYRALAYKKMRKYTDSIFCLKRILEKKTIKNTSDDLWISQFFIDSSDTQYFDALIGEMLILKGKCSSGLSKYRSVIFKDPLIKSANTLFDEDNRIEPICILKNDVVMDYYTNLFCMKDLICSFHNINDESIEKNVFVMRKNQNILKTITNFLSKFNLGYFKSYIMVKTAVTLAQMEFENESLSIFEAVREFDPLFIKDMDRYSTLLWKTKNEGLLGLLAKDMIQSAPSSNLTWIAIANYYSLRGQNRECILALHKSISILESSHAYTLLGFECNARSQYLEAQSYFKASLHQSVNNDRALFGLGISCAETFKLEMAIEYFSTALKINPTSLHMVAYLIRFYVKNKEYEKALSHVEKIFFNGGSHRDYHAMVKFISDHCGEFLELEELVLCEFAEILFYYDHKDLATIILDNVECRTSAYYSKRALIEN